MYNYLGLSACYVKQNAGLLDILKNLSQGLVEINNNSYISNLVYIESILRNNNEH